MSAEPEEDIALYSDERKLRRFAMDVLREAFELRLTPFAARELAERWGLIIATEQDGRPWDRVDTDASWRRAKWPNPLNVHIQPIQRGIHSGTQHLR